MTVTFDTYPSGDRLALARMTCLPAGPPADVIVHLHGFESHNGWVRDLGERLAARGLALVGLDRRGSGRSDGPPGDAPDNAALVDDVRRAVAAARARWPSARIHLMGLCLGARIALLYAREDRDLAGVVLASPSLFLRRHSQKPLLARLAIALDARLRPARRHRSSLATWMFSADPAVQARLDRDPHRLQAGTARFMWNLWVTASTDALLDDAARLEVPVRAYLAAARDQVLDAERTAGRLRQAGATVRVFPEAGHLLYFDVVDALVDDLVRALPAPASTTAPRGSHA